VRGDPGDHGQRRTLQPGGGTGSREVRVQRADELAGGLDPGGEHPADSAPGQLAGFGGQLLDGQLDDPAPAGIGHRVGQLDLATDRP